MKIKGIKKLISVGEDKLSEYDLEKGYYSDNHEAKVKADVFIYSYINHGYGGSGMAVWKRDGKWRYLQLGHCSCYGPTENLEKSDGITATLPKLIKLFEKEYSYCDATMKLVKYLKENKVT